MILLPEMILKPNVPCSYAEYQIVIALNTKKHANKLEAWQTAIKEMTPYYQC